MTSLRQVLSDRSRQPTTRSALVIQGGGMRGVYSMGALAQLEREGLSNSFDYVIGSSAGAINGAYLLAEQAEEAVGIYVNSLSNRNFISFRRWSKIVDIDYMVDTALRIHLPINVEKISSSTSKLRVVLTDAETAEAVVMTPTSSNDIYELFRATAALPSLYDRRVRIGDRDYVDGGIADAVPVEEAVQLGAHLILAVLTRRPGYRRNAHGPIYKGVGRLMARNQSRAIKHVIGREDRRFNEAMDLLEGKRQVPGGLRSISVWPSDNRLLVSRTTSDRKRLAECAEMGARDMKEALDLRI